MILRYVFRLACVMALIALPRVGQAALESDVPLPDQHPHERRAVVEVMATRLERSYVLADVASRMAATLRANAAAGRYDGIDSLQEFARQLTEELRAISKDGHLRVHYHADPAQVLPAWNTPGPEPEARYRRHAERTNYGFVRVEILRGNVGFLRFDEFGDPALGGDTLAAVMQFVAKADALIIDLRYNGGGGGMGAVLATYLLGAGGDVHLSDFQIREKSETLQLWTLPHVAGPVYPRSVYLLVGAGTASAAESFTYMLQNRKRVRVVGQKTAGAANPGGFVRFSKHLAMFVPNGRPVDPLTGTNWEGVGIRPDLEIKESDASDVAHRLALEELLAGKETSEDVRADWRDALARLTPLK